MATVKIERTKCTNCKKCIETCPVHVFGMENELVVVKDASKCIVCRACEVQCPHKAIEVHEPAKVAEHKPEHKPENKAEEHKIEHKAEETKAQELKS
jgi:NAD-dependent dihydropyrimidine dehydrogenase PreA subunit